MTACIVGWAHSMFGRLDGATVETLIGEVAHQALTHAGVDASDIDAVFLGHFNSGFSVQDFTAPLVLTALPALRFKPTTRLENACATGSAAVMAAADCIAARRARMTLVIGVEKMTHLPTSMVGDILLHACYRPEEAEIAGGFAGVFGRIAKLYFQHFGDQSEALAMIAAKNHHNGLDNPFAQIKKDFGFAFCNTVSDKNPFVAGPLRRSDCAPISDGAAAIVLADLPVARTLKRAVWLRGRAHTTDLMPMSARDMSELGGAARAWRDVLADARLTLDDLDLVETHDCFTIAELMQYEAMGLTATGQGARAVREGWTYRDGKLPVNVSGGLKAKGHPIGATGVSMHALAVRQLFGEAGPAQLKHAGIAGVFNMGGTGVANYASIMERVR